MGADYCTAVLPKFKITSARMKKLHAMVKDVQYADEEEVAGARHDELRQALDDLIEHVDGREVGELWLEGMDYRVWTTGGMSSGEPPTDAFELFYNIEDATAIYDQMLVWAREDWKKEQAKKKAKPRK